VGRRKTKKTVHEPGARESIATTRTVPSDPPKPADIKSAILGNLVVLAVFSYAAVLATKYPDFFYQSVAEDSYFEWMTFWAFFLGTGVFTVASFRQRRTMGKVPWFLAGVALFCFLVSMEEISWGQRLIGYRPPVYFLENNFQQELNIHNTVGDALRQLTFQAVIAGYGILLPLVLMVPLLRTLVLRMGIVGPSPWLMPAFLASLILYIVHPWRFAAEIAELMLGLSFLCAGAALLHGYRQDTRASLPLRAPILTAALCLLIGCLGILSTAWVSRQRSADPAAIEAARMETHALLNDFLVFAAQKHADIPTPCGLHHRLHTVVEMAPLPEMHRGSFAALTRQGLPEVRAEFFIDPWNAPYWIWHDSCTTRSHTVSVYSFGPNGRRDSTAEGPGGDDIGETVVIDRPLPQILAKRLANDRRMRDAKEH